MDFDRKREEAFRTSASFLLYQDPRMSWHSRYTLVCHLIQFHLQSDLPSYVLCLAVGIFDTFLSTRQQVKMDEMAMLMALCYLTSIKFVMDDIPIHLEQLNTWCGKKYTSDQWRHLERYLLPLLGHSLFRPIPYRYLHAFVKRHPEFEKVWFLCHVLSVMSLLDTSATLADASNVAQSILYIATTVYRIPSPDVAPQDDIKENAVRLLKTTRDYKGMRPQVFKKLLGAATSIYP